MLSVGTAKLTQAAINSASTNKITLQAQQYAASKADIVKATKYDELTAQNKTVISNSDGFYDEVSVSAESEYPGNSNISQRECIIRVYKDSEALPRSSLKLMRYSVSTEASSVPQGSIIPWYGDKSNIPDGFALCDGQNGTPDLRNRFLVGAGDAYKLAAVGGESTHVLSINEMPWHNHNASSAVGYFRSRSNTFYGKGPSSTLGWNAVSGCFSIVEQGLRSEGNADSNSTEYIVKFDGSKIVQGQGSNNPHENRPPYYALYYIMKL